MLRAGPPGREILPLTELAVQAVAAGEYWRVQRHSLLTLPEHLGTRLLRTLAEQGRLSPAVLELFQNSATTVCLAASYSHGSGADWLAALSTFRCLQSLHLHAWTTLRAERLALLASLAPHLRTLHLPRCSGQKGDMEDSLRLLTGLTDLNLAGAQGYHGGSLSGLTMLTALDLSDLRLQSAQLTWLSSLSSLCSLNLAATSFDDGGLRVLTNLQQLTYLDLTWTQVTQPPGLPSLRCLTMASCWLASHAGQSSPTGLQLLDLSAANSAAEVVHGLLAANAASLTKLVLSDAPVKDFSWLASATRMRHLDLSGTGVNDDALIGMPCMPDLQCLVLSRNRVSTSCIGYLAGASRLQHFELEGTDVNSLRNLQQHCTGLRHLNITRLHLTRIDDMMLPGWASFQHLQVLRCQGVQLIDLRGLNALAPTLVWLEIGGNDFGDAAFGAIGALTNLRYLQLTGRQMTGRSLDSLRYLSALRILSLVNCLLVSDAGAMGLAARLPRLLELWLMSRRLYQRKETHPNAFATCDQADARPWWWGDPDGGNPLTVRLPSLGPGKAAGHRTVPARPALVSVADAAAWDERLTYSRAELFSLNGSMRRQADSIKSRLYAAGLGEILQPEPT